MNKTNENVTTANVTIGLIQNREQQTAIEDFMSQLVINLERAECIVSDVRERYFCEREITNQNRWKLEVQYAEYSTKIEIANDYLFQLKEVIQKADLLLGEEYENYFKRRKQNDRQ